MDQSQSTDPGKLISDFSYALEVIDSYDHEKLGVSGVTKDDTYKITYEDARVGIDALGKQLGASDLFGYEKDSLFKSSLVEIYQTFDGKPLYPSVEEKAANLLYFIAKNHSFSDGNKRIAAFLFIWFMAQNGILYKSDGSRRLENNALVALTFLAAESASDKKDSIVSLIVNLINDKN